jgi:hypothetical protein
VIYHGKPNLRHRQAQEAFDPVDFIAAITQHIPEQGAQMVRYYGWYSNKSRGMRAQRARELAGADWAHAGQMLIEIAPYQPRRGASKKWRELIKKVWEVDPLLCPNCQGEMKIIALIDARAVIEKILKQLGLWQPGRPARAPPAVTRQAEGLDPLPDYEVEPILFPATGTRPLAPLDPFPNYDTDMVIFTE